MLDFVNVIADRLRNILKPKFHYEEQKETHSWFEPPRRGTYPSVGAQTDEKEQMHVLVYCH